MLSVLLDDLRAVDPDVDVTILTIDDVKEGATFEGFPVRPTLMHRALNRYQTPATGLYSAWVVVVTLVAAVARRRVAP